MLLDKHKTAIRLRSPSGRLFLRSGNSAGWQTLPGEVRLQWNTSGTRATLTLNGKPLPRTSLTLRGGHHPSDFIEYEGKVYRGAIRAIPESSGWMLTNVVPMADYLAGTLGREMHPSWHLEALKAQAVASRTYALYMAAHPKNSHYDLVGTVMDQVYTGASPETDRIRQAVEETRDLYLAEGGQPAKVYFHARCGGRTTSERHVWNSPRELHTDVPCLFCNRNPYVWEASIPVSSLLKALNLKSALQEKPRLEPVRQGSFGRIHSLKLKAGNQEKAITGDNLRRFVGYSTLKSTSLKWRVEEDRVHFEGVGLGHGVGMCQWGAQHLARQGKSHREILRHYYPRLELRSSLPLAQKKI